jgi:hypothetical protein
MTYKQTTQVPNFVFDNFLSQLTEAELKILLVVIRQTIGWFDKATGKRKSRDRITGSQFIKKTGMSKRVITKTIQSLSVKKLIQVTDFGGKELFESLERKGKTHLFFTLHPVHLTTLTSAPNISEPVHETYHNKTNYTKLKETKLRRHFAGHIGKFIQDRPTLF